MPLFSKILTGGLSIALTLAVASAADAQTAHHSHKKPHVAAPRQTDVEPLAPGVELRTSTSAPQGSENHYFSDTVAAGQTNLLQHDSRYGQSPTPYYNSTEPLFRF
jgi:hypothetical protein